MVVLQPTSKLSARPVNGKSAASGRCLTTGAIVSSSGRRLQTGAAEYHLHTDGTELGGLRGMHAIVECTALNDPGARCHARRHNGTCGAIQSMLVMHPMLASVLQKVAEALSCGGREVETVHGGLVCRHGRHRSLP